MQTTLKLDNGLVLSNVSDEQVKTFRGREACILSYCENKGWDSLNLDITQIMEIRKQSGWKTPSAP